MEWKMMGMATANLLEYYRGGERDPLLHPYLQLITSPDCSYDPKQFRLLLLKGMS